MQKASAFNNSWLPSALDIIPHIYASAIGEGCILNVTNVCEDTKPSIMSSGYAFDAHYVVIAKA